MSPEEVEVRTIDSNDDVESLFRDDADGTDVSIQRATTAMMMTADTTCQSDNMEPQRKNNQDDRNNSGGGIPSHTPILNLYGARDEIYDVDSTTNNRSHNVATMLTSESATDGVVVKPTDSASKSGRNTNNGEMEDCPLSGCGLPKAQVRLRFLFDSGAMKTL